jgi:outer membrane protein TolC
MSGTRNYLFEGERGIEDSYAVGVEVQIPIFTGFRNQSRIRQAEALAKSAYEEGRAKELSVAREVWASFFRFEAAQRQTRAATALLSAAQESYKAVETGYLNGANSVLDLLAAQRDLSDARKSLIAAQANCGIAFVELSLAAGTLAPPGG